MGTNLKPSGNTKSARDSTDMGSSAGCSTGCSIVSLVSYRCSGDAIMDRIYNHALYLDKSFLVVSGGVNFSKTFSMSFFASFLVSLPPLNYSTA
jgi:hypothetical protein